MYTYEEFWNNLREIKKEYLPRYDSYLTDANRSSAIFPVYKQTDIATHLIFLAYWLKKHGNQVVARLIFRSPEGANIDREYVPLLDYRPVELNVSDAFGVSEVGFVGSVEVEVYSRSQPRFPYPAITLMYTGENGSSVVHSGIRFYNHDENPSDYVIYYPQTGFDIIPRSGFKNFICFFGGNKENYELDIYILENGHREKKSLNLINPHHGKMHIIYLEDVFGEKVVRSFHKPKVDIVHCLDDIFPRFYVGSESKHFVPTLTHTFFDTSLDESKSLPDGKILRAENPNNSEYFDSAVMVPIYPCNKFSTSLVTYGQSLSFDGPIEVRIYSEKGAKLYSRMLSEAEADSLSLRSEFSACELISEAKLSSNDKFALYFGFRGELKPFPIRFKFGLNVKRNSQVAGSNICFSPFVQTNGSLSKPFTRRWFPLGGANNFVASIHNTDISLTQRESIVPTALEFVNSKGEIMSRNVSLKQNESLFIDVIEDEYLRTFFGNTIGWCMVTSESYLLDGYYFSMTGSLVGGDHVY